MPVHFNIHKLLSADDLAELKEFARHPARTVDECHDWVLAKGYRIGRTAVYKWKRNFNLTDRFSASADAARSLMAAAKHGGTAAISDAAMVQLAQMMFEKMIDMKEEGRVETKELRSLSAALRNLVQGKRYVEKLRGEMADAIKVAEKESRKGASGEQIISKLREALGMPQADQVESQTNAQQPAEPAKDE